MCSLYLGENLISGSKPINLGVRNIGEIVSSAIPLTDAGLHLLDGSLILGGGIYQGFIDYIAELYGDGTNIPSYFCTESEWQTSVTTYGVCGKFVYDSVNNTVRLPKTTGIVEGTTDVTALGDLVEAGMPNITGNFSPAIVSGHRDYCKGAFGGGNGGFTDVGSRGIASMDVTGAWGYSFDASRSNPIYGNSSTVQPQTIKAFIYIVIANSTKTDIQVDIDEVATDLNGKADTDLTNVTDSAKVMMSGMGMPGSKYVSLTFTPNTNYTAPADGYFVVCRTGNAGQYFNMYNNSTTTAANGVRVATGFNAPSNGQYRFWVPIAKGDKIYIGTNFSGSSSTYDYFGFVYAQGSESEAQ